MTVPNTSNITNHIRLDQNTFKKSAKRLRDEVINEMRLIELNTPVNEKIYNRLHVNFDLSKIHECLSKSLGFKNYDAINHYFNKGKSQHPAFKTGKILDHWNAEEIISLITFLSPAPNDNSLEKDRAIILLDIVVHVLVYLRDAEEILLFSNGIMDFLTLRSLWNTYITRRDFPAQLRSQLRAYFHGLPNFNIEHENSNLIDDSNITHTSSQMYFYSALKILDKIEKCDPMIISPYWYQTNYILYNTNEDNLNYLALKHEDSCFNGNSLRVH